VSFMPFDVRDSSGCCSSLISYVGRVKKGEVVKMSHSGGQQYFSGGSMRLTRVR
jgi:hypothetical protein